MIAKISALGIDHFKLIWATVLVLVVLVGFLLGERDRRAVAHGLREEFSLTLERRDWAFLSALLVLFAGYVFLTLFGEDFAGYDDTIFTTYSVRGLSHRPPIWPEEGRFFPLGHQEFNYLRVVTRSITGYHLFAMAELALLLAAVFFALRELRVSVRVGLMALLLVTPSLLISFMGLIYVERNDLVLFALFIVAVQGYARRGSVVFLVCSLVLAHAALYFKEIAFVIVSAFAGARLLIAWREARLLEPRQRLRQVAEAHLLDLALLALVAIYLLMLAVALLPHGGSGYANKMRNPSQGVLTLCLAYLELDVLLPILAIAFVTRMARLWRARQLPDPIWDPLALGALGYAAAVLALRMFSPYYMAPVDLIAVLYLGWLSVRCSHPRLVLAIACLVAVQDVAVSYFRVLERKNTLAGKIALEGFLKSYQPASAGQIRLFFPYTRPYRMMELAGFLSYKGLGIPSDRVAQPLEHGGIVLAGPSEFPNGHCVDYREFLCVHAAAPQPGDLIVLLPDDVVPAGAGRALEGQHKLLYARLPVGAPRAAQPIFSLLRVASDSFSNAPLPDDWLELRVFAYE